MPILDTVNQINEATIKYAPAVLNGVLEVEKAAAGLPGQTKTDIIVSTIMAGAAAAQNVPNPTVQGIAALASIMVSILNAAGIFNHKQKSA